MFEALRRKWAKLWRHAEEQRPPPAVPGEPTAPVSREAPRRPEDRPPAPKPKPLAINLGIDFGTSFTKVCFRDVVTERSGIVKFPGAQVGLIHSLVGINESGELIVSLDADKPPRADVVIGYLKMRLANEPIMPVFKTIAGIDLSTTDCVRALSSWFLAKILDAAKKRLEIDEAALLHGRTVNWSANVGVPVEYCDSEEIDIFREVLGVAWSWWRAGTIPRTLGEALAAYEPADQARTDFHAVPEIAAGVRSFIISRSAEPGIYVYFDIGGGTVDGVSFKFFTDDGERKLNFYSGKVAALGIAAAASRADPEAQTRMEQQLYAGDIPEPPSKELRNVRRELQQLVGKVVITGKGKDPHAWEGSSMQGHEYFRRLGLHAPGQRDRKLLVFVGGGGAPSPWYRNAISSTHAEFKHDSYGIAAYQLASVPVPSDLDLGGLKSNRFSRFAIAYGLSIPDGEGPEVRLPSQFDTIDVGPAMKAKSKTVAYEDSKEAFQ